MVLLKGYSDEGFRFFTNYESRKGSELVRKQSLFLSLTLNELKNPTGHLYSPRNDALVELLCDCDLQSEFLVHQFVLD